MTPTDFDYARAGSLDEALTMLAEGGMDAKLLAGGHSLLPAMKLRLSMPSTLIDISEIEELSGVEERDGKLHVGALTTHRILEYSDLAKAKCPALAELASHIGDPQVRNRGTIGGSLAHADPAADYPALVLALGADIEMAGRDGTRTVAADDFFTGMYETALEDGEVITRVSFPVMQAGQGAAYAKFANPASRYAVVGVAAMVAMRGGSCESARVAVTGAAPTAFRVPAVESALSGTSLSDDDIARAVAGMVDAGDMMEDLSGSAEYRAHLCEVQAKKAIRQAADQAR
jgi:carbon-monoxide dehydrogenase medium subunit